MSSVHDRRRVDQGEEEPPRRKSTAPRARPPGKAATLWREEARCWRRVDGRTWPLRPAAALAKELAAFDRLIPCRVPPESAPGPSYAVRRVWRDGALMALRVCASVAALERRAATYARDSAVRRGAEFAARKTAELAKVQRARIAALPVAVPWGGRLVGRGVAG